MALTICTARALVNLKSPAASPGTNTVITPKKSLPMKKAKVAVRFMTLDFSTVPLGA